MKKKKKLYKPSKFKQIAGKPLRLFGWFILLILSSYGPVYTAQIYENGIYSMSGYLTKIEAAHYSNMITWGYNVAALVTVLLCSLILRHIYKIIKNEV